MGTERTRGIVANDSVKQEVVVTDIGMRFSSMVVFMVKWAIASIPALIILFVVGAFFWSVMLAFFLSPWRTSMARSAASGAGSGTSSALGSVSNGGKSAGPSPAEVGYLGKIVVRNVSVGQSVLGEKGVFAEIKNTGNHTLKEVEITVYCLGSDGKPIFEKKYYPVLVSEFSADESNQPLKPSYVRKFGVNMEDAPSEWHKGVDVKVTGVEFQ